MTIADKGFIVFGEETTSGGNFSSNKLWRFTPNTVGITETASSTHSLSIAYLQSGAVRIFTELPITQEGSIQIFDLSGKLMFQQIVAAGSPLNIELDLNVAPGIYSALLISGIDKVSSRFVLGMR